MAPGAMGYPLAEHHQLAGMRQGQRLQQDRVNHAEDGSDRANAEGQREDGGEGKSGRSAQGANAEAQILKKTGHAKASGTEPFQWNEST